MNTQNPNNQSLWTSTLSVRLVTGYPQVDASAGVDQEETSAWLIASQHREDLISPRQKLEVVPGRAAPDRPRQRAPTRAPTFIVKRVRRRVAG